jgi:hypothetical protein
MIKEPFFGSNKKEEDYQLSSLVIFKVTHRSSLDQGVELNDTDTSSIYPFIFQVY